MDELAGWQEAERVRQAWRGARVADAWLGVRNRVAVAVYERFPQAWRGWLGEWL